MQNANEFEVRCVLITLKATYDVKLFDIVHKLNIEQKRHRKIPFGKRLCPHCKKEVEDEYYFASKCQILENCRQTRFQEVESIVASFNKMSNVEFDLIVLRNSLPEKE